MSDGSYREVADSLCSNNGPMSIGSDTSNERPLDRETCLLESCPTWETGNWSQVKLFYSPFTRLRGCFFLYPENSFEVLFPFFGLLEAAFKYGPIFPV